MDFDKTPEAEVKTGADMDTADADRDDVADKEDAPVEETHAAEMGSYEADAGGF